VLEGGEEEEEEEEEEEDTTNSSTKACRVNVQRNRFKKTLRAF
jgi:hypothetical protein